jgi:hypothetical protein
MKKKKLTTKKKSFTEREKKLRERLEFFNMKSWVELPSQSDLLCALEDAMELIESLNEGLKEDNLMKSIH